MLEQDVKDALDGRSNSPWYEGKTVEDSGFKFSCIKEHGGYEGAGEEYWIVISAEREGEESTFWRIDGFYASHYGSELDWSTLHQVTPRPKTITVWE